MPESKRISQGSLADVWRIVPKESRLGPKVFERICEMESSESARLTYDYITQQPMIKYMPGPIHDMPCGRVKYEIMGCVRNILGHTW